MNNVEFTNTHLSDIIELKNINQVYFDKKTKKDFVAIKDLNLLIEDKPNQGQFVVVLGKSGCGKSTVLRYIAGLQKPTSGEILIKGKPRTSEDKVGMVFQKYSSFPWLYLGDEIWIMGANPGRIVEKIQIDIPLTRVKEMKREKKFTDYVYYIEDKLNSL
jgi:ABC-type nitrate/sulfonate/bicarbonate transport system ATPase subunit